jgi:hypothetical protein
MAFNTVTDYYGLADGTMLAAKAATENAAAQLVEAPPNDKGDIPAHEVLATIRNPSCDYEMLAAWARGAESTPNPVQLGGLTAIDSKAFVLSQLTINTGAGSAPAISASGGQVMDGADEGDVYDIPAFSVAFKHTAQILWSAFTLSGTGCHLTQANYTASVNLSRGTVNGGTVSHDVQQGKITATITISQVGDAAPTLTPGTGWSVTGVLTKSKPDAQYPTWTATLTKYLTKKIPSS